MWKIKWFYIVKKITVWYESKKNEKIQNMTKIKLNKIK